MSAMNYRNRVVIVTGAGRGLGREYALAFAARGAAVVVNDLGTSLDGTEAGTHQPADDVAAEILRAGGKAVANHASVISPEGAATVVAAAINEFGRVDTLVNNAGILDARPFEEVTLESLEKHLGVHVRGTFLMCKAAWPHMVAQQYGRIVNTVSGGIFGLPGITAYGPAKGGVFAFTRTLALEALPHGIRVNAVAPQGATRMWDGSSLTPALRAQLDAVVKPSLAVHGPLYLGHEECSINGETLAVSGGKVCRIGMSCNEGISDSNLTPEMIRDRLHDVLDETTARIWTSATALYNARAESS